VANADLSAPLALPVTAGESPPPAWWSPDGTRLAALSSDFGAAEIVVVASAGGTPSRVTQGARKVVVGVWHPDGERFTYVARNESGTIQTFAVSTVTGVTTRLLPDEVRHHIAIVSPDGSRIAYNLVGLNTIWVADSAGRNRRQLTTEGSEFFIPWRNPWSPDGAEILYQSRASGRFDLRIAPVDGTPPRPVTREDHNNIRGTWSPDGRWIAFESDRGGQVDLWVVPSAGGDEQRVTDTPDDVYGGPVWRPGPSPSIAFVSLAQQSGLWALDLADGAERRLTPDSLRVAYFNVSTSGRYANLVISRGDEIEDLAVMPIGGGPLRTLVSVRGGTLDKPLWSPDDSMILFGSDQAGTPDIWVVDVASGSSRQITNWPSEERNHRWSGAGTVVFASDRDARLNDLWRADPAGGEPVRITTHGDVEVPIARGGLADVFVADWESRTGQAFLSRVRPDGSLQTIWDRSNVVPKRLSPTGEWLAALVVQPDGGMQGMLLSTKGGAHSVVLNVGEEPLAWSQDGTRLLYSIQSDAAGDLAILNVADSTTHRLTITPENENRGAFIPDGNMVVFQRDRTVQRIFTVDLSTVLRKEP
jgi:Tol biopolymer transport system component